MWLQCHNCIKNIKSLFWIHEEMCLMGSKDFDWGSKEHVFVLTQYFFKKLVTWMLQKIKKELKGKNANSNENIISMLITEIQKLHPILSK